MTDSYNGFQVEAIYCLTQNGVDLSTPYDLDYVYNSNWGGSGIGYGILSYLFRFLHVGDVFTFHAGGGKVFNAKNGMKYLFLSGQRRGGMLFLAFDPEKK